VGLLPLEFTRFSNTRTVPQNAQGAFGRESVWTHNYQWLMRDAGVYDHFHPSIPIVPGEPFKPRRLVRITFPDGSDHTFMNPIPADEEQMFDSTAWISLDASTCSLQQNGSSYRLQRQDGSLCHFTAHQIHTWLLNGNQLKWVVLARHYQLTSIEDSIGNEYTFEYLSEYNKLVSKIIDASGRFLEISYTDQTADLSLKTVSYASVYHSSDTLGQWNEIQVSSPKAARYLTLINKDRHAIGSGPPVAEIEFYDENDVLISGTPFGAAPYFSSGNAPGKAFDGSTSTTYRHANPINGYVGIDCGTSKIVSRIRYYLPSNGPYGSATLEFAGLSVLSTANPVISQVTASDGRSVSYTYSTVTDDSGWFTWSVLDGAQYSDSTAAIYSYGQTAPFSRPLMTHCMDPRIRGNGTAIEYVYDLAGPIGFLKEERTGITGYVLGGTDFDDAQKPKAVYPGGRIVKYEYSAAHGKCLIRENGLGQKAYYSYDPGGFTSETTDERGFTTAYTNTSTGLPLVVEFPDGAVHEFTYDARGRVLSAIESGPSFSTRTTTYTRDSLGRVTLKTYPDGSTEAWTYNSYGQPTSHTLRNGSVEYLAYDSAGRLLTHSNPLGGLTTYTYDSVDRVATTTDPLGRIQSFLYNDRGKILRQTHPDGTWSEFEYDDADNLIGQVNELGNVWTTSYDELRNVLTETDPLQRVTTYSYSDNAPGSCGTCVSAGKPASITSPGGQKTRFTYDEEWRLSAKTVAPGTSAEAITQYAHDAAGNVIQIAEPGGSITTYTYDSRNRLLSTTDPLGRISYMTYDLAGNVLTEKRPDNGIHQHTYDLMNRRLTSRDPKNQTTTFTYDAEGNLASLTDARGKTYAWLHNAANLTTRKNYPDGSYESWTYNTAYQRLTSRARNGAISTSTFDLRGRELTVDWSDSTPDITRAFDATGHLLSSGNGLSTSSYTYDIAGQQLTETQHLHGIAPALPAYTVSYTWDADGRNATLTYPGGTVVSRTYTARGQVETISEGAPPPLVSYVYNPAGTRASKILENGTVTHYGYDAAHQLTSLSHNLSSTPLQTRAYQYNSVGNRTAMQVDGSTWDVYGFDAVDQITSAKYQASSSSGVSPQRTVSYDWDPVGNREQVQDIPASGSTITDVYATANAVNQYPAINGSSVSHDSNGNLTAARLQNASAGPVATLTYDSNNRLLSVQNGSDSVTSTYDTRNRVTSRTINGTTTLFLWDDWDLIEERDLSGSQTRRYVHGAGVDEILIMVDGAGAKYHHHDALGSVTALTDSNGAIIESYLYDVFGQVSIFNASGSALSASSVDNRFLYTGREWIAQASLYDYRNRVYSPVIGRFLQTDPIRFKAGDVNLYRYVGNGVCVLVDASGLGATGTAWGAAIGGGLGATVGGSIGAAGGTLALPGGGTVAGGYALGSAGLVGGAALGAVVGNFVEEAGSAVMDAASDVADGISEGLSEIGDTLSDTWESRGRSHAPGERGKERKNPNPKKEKKHDHQTGKKLDPKKDPKPKQPEPDVIPKGKRKCD